ncbi:aminotransferase class I/II-fold pyridoxal phosphate-dependent enzyme [Alicyclobacillus tolerans]|uniref:aminotransferase class I/II-fold pyridoxal phosphate-dependent enzyme n=1 Tax=Alicyclobacillus tolerans TaxID=90970 RepID=UPI001F0228E4|nr:aminotransferase class I/II-fold pyridoxal phosphate-dependent enzyme [Alicyclobacillus tolerans]MCF8566444.1 aminotransferase class I/II-fold pyridoxal phosphate-dependent enzyme [Alicyclobacillus tolerans]
MEFTAADRMIPLSTGIFTELAQKKRQVVESGAELIDLTVGSPDLPPPQIVVETLIRYAQDTTRYGYTLTGIPSFLNAAASFYGRRYGVELDPSREVVQLMGSQDGLAHLATAFVNPGDYVLVPDPGYPIYSASVQIAGGNLYKMPLRPENGFLPNLDDIPQDVLSKARMMIVSYPGNPVTALAGPGFFKQVIEFAKRHGILVVHDFAYSELVFDGIRPESFLATPGAKEVGIEFNSLSKTFNMAGCRIGYAVGNAQALAILSQLKSNIDYGVFYPIQKAAEAALTSGFSGLKTLADTYEQRRNTLVSGLKEAGWPVETSQATMFLWARIPEGWTSREFSFALLEQTGVGVTPGDAFGGQGEGFVRIALVQPSEKLAEAARRIGTFLRAHADTPR